MKILKLAPVAFAAALVASASTTTPAFAHSDNECIYDVHEFCGDSDYRCKHSGRLACLNHHAGGTPPPPPDPAYSTPNGGPIFGNGGLKLQAQ